MGKKKIKRRGGNKAVNYSRYSSSKQQEQSIEAQQRECAKFAESKGLEIVEYYKDEAKSGTEMTKRDGLQDMLEYLSIHPEIGYVIIYKIDRLSRNDMDRIQILDALAKMGVVLLKSAEINADGAAGYINDSIAGILATHYSMELSAKTARGMMQSAINGTSTGAKPPLGYKWHKKRLVVDRKKAPAVQLAFSMYAEGKSKTEICEYLNSLGYTNNSGKPFKRSDFANLFSNRKYLGEWWFNGELVNPKGNKPLIDVETFDRVQKQLKSNKRQAGGEKRQKREYAVSGRIFCMKCGAPMIAIGGTGRGDKQYYYYACKNTRCKDCDKKNERQDVVDEWLRSEIINTFDLHNPEKFDEVANRIADLYTTRKPGDTITIKKQSLATAQRDADRLCEMLLRLPDSDTIIKRLAETEERIKQLKADIEQAKILASKNPQVPQIKEWLQALIDNSHTGVTRDLIKACIHSVYMDNDGKAIIFWQVGNRVADPDEIKAVIEGYKNSTYTVTCIDADQCGSLGGAMLEHVAPPLLRAFSMLERLNNEPCKCQ